MQKITPYLCAALRELPARGRFAQFQPTAGGAAQTCS
jgi:hypothetical protein